MQIAVRTAGVQHTCRDGGAAALGDARRHGDTILVILGTRDVIGRGGGVWRDRGLRIDEFPQPQRGIGRARRRRCGRAGGIRGVRPVSIVHAGRNRDRIGPRAGAAIGIRRGHGECRGSHGGGSAVEHAGGRIQSQSGGQAATGHGISVGRDTARGADRLGVGQPQIAVGKRSRIHRDGGAGAAAQHGEVTHHRIEARRSTQCDRVSCAGIHRRGKGHEIVVVGHGGARSVELHLPGGHRADVRGHLHAIHQHFGEGRIEVNTLPVDPGRRRGLRRCERERELIPGAIVRRPASIGGAFRAG
jgi:hypothetical protein